MELLGLPLVPLAAGVLAVMALGFMVLALRALTSGGDEVITRLGQQVTAEAPYLEARRADDERGFFAAMMRPFAWLARPARADAQSRLRRSLIQAGYRGQSTPEIFLGIKILLAPALTLLFLQVHGRAGRPLELPIEVAVALWICACAFFLPNLWLRGAVRDRQRKIERSIPDALDILVTCVEAGLGLDAALAKVSEEMNLAAPILAGELETTHLEVQAGIPRADAFRRMAERTGVEDLRSLSAMLIQTEMFGSSIARALRVQAEGIRIRRTQQAEERAAMVGVKLTVPLILCILPSLIAVVMGPAIANIVRAFGGQ